MSIIHVVEVLAVGNKKQAQAVQNAKIVSCKKVGENYKIVVEAKADLVVNAMPLVKGRVNALGLTLLNVISYVCYKESISGKRTEIVAPVGSFAEKDWSLPQLGDMSNEEVLQTVREVFGITADHRSKRTLMDDLLCI